MVSATIAKTPRLGEISKPVLKDGTWDEEIVAVIQQSNPESFILTEWQWGI